MRAPRQYEDEEAHSLMWYLLLVLFDRRGEELLYSEGCVVHVKTLYIT